MRQGSRRSDQGEREAGARDEDGQQQPDAGAEMVEKTGSASALAATLRKAGTGLVVVVTGAGVSAASGLPPFRGSSPDAIWNRDVTEIGTFRFFTRDPVAWWQWFLGSFAGLAEASQSRPSRAGRPGAVADRTRRRPPAGLAAALTQHVQGIMTHEWRRGPASMAGAILLADFPPRFCRPLGPVRYLKLLRYNEPSESAVGENPGDHTLFVDPLASSTGRWGTRRRQRCRGSAQSGAIEFHRRSGPTQPRFPRGGFSILPQPAT